MSVSSSIPANAVGGEPPAPVDPSRSPDSPDSKERRNAIAVAAAVGGAGAVAIAVPFVASFAPSERAKAAGAPVEFDVSVLRVLNTLPKGPTPLSGPNQLFVWFVLSLIVPLAAAGWGRVSGWAACGEPLACARQQGLSVPALASP